MDFSQTARPRLLASLLLAGGIALLGCALKKKLLAASYDSLHSLAALKQEVIEDSRVVIVYLDLASYLHEHQNPAERWPRNLHARLLQRLTAQGARAVVFDMLFDMPSDDHSADLAFVAALKQNSRAILAAEHNNKVSHETSANQPWTRSTMLRLPDKPFAESAAGWGVASLWVDDDFVVRRHLPAFGADRVPSLSLAAAKFIGTDNDLSSRELWVRYYGPALAIPHVSYSEALDLAALPSNFFLNKIVLVGARPIEGFMDARRDELRSPFHAWSNKEYFMPGVEVHATQLLNLLRGDALQRLSPSGENICLFAVALLFGGGLLWLRPIAATIGAGAGAGLVLAISLYGFSRGLWFPWLVASAAQIPGALFGSWLSQFQEWFLTRRKLEAAKRIADAKIQQQAALIDKAHDAILVQDLHGTIVYANPSAEKLYGWQLSELNPEAAAEVLSPDVAAIEEARATTLKDGEWNGELRQQTKSGHAVIVASRWTLIRDESGQPGALLLINSDITEKKSLEQQFLRTQRMNTIGTLAGGMAHDLNNALAPVLLGTQLLRRKTDNKEDLKLLSLIETSTNRSADMVRQVLLFARGRGGEFERLELGPLVKELVKIVVETFPKDVRVESFVPIDLWPVRGNSTQLHQVLLNLCVNARDAMPQGGRLSFAADNVELQESEAAKIRDGKAGAYVSLLVSDTGAGMSPEVQARIFEPFFTTKSEGVGTGIGLSTVQRIVKGHGGFLKVESEPALGTTFEIFLPCALDAAGVSAVSTGIDIPRGAGELILVADDEQAVRDLVREGLIAHGYRVLAVANGDEALKLFRQHADEIQLFLTDSSMPVMDGMGAINEIRKLKAGLPVILASGEAPSEDALRKDDFRILSKPFSLEDVLASTHQMLAPTRSKTAD